MPLPLEITRTSDAVSLECAGCGAKYRGRLWARIPDHLKGNARIVRSAAPDED